MHVHDFVAVGLGPFNLGLACLTEPLDELDGLFLEARDEFSWHPGLMLPEATLQVPFMADLVTMADPTSRWSFLNFLKTTGRLYPFYIRESFYALRREYDAYCRWAAGQLPDVRFGQAVTSVVHEAGRYVVTTATGEQHAGRRLVLGTGTTPYLPEPLRAVAADGGPVLHTADYLHRKDDLLAREEITVVGSGQSAAEVYADLLAEQPAHGYHLTWLTRSPRFFPMEYTKLTLEMTSPEWTRHFQGLSQATRDHLRGTQQALSKGISADTINEIYDALYAASVDREVPTTLLTATEVTGAERVGGGVRLDLRHAETGEPFALTTGAVVAGTGYASALPAFLDWVRDRLVLDDRGRFAATERYAVDVTGADVFVQNGEEHTHGFVAPDLGMGAYRNSVIIATMLGREVYPVETRIAFQEFGVPERFAGSAAPGVPAPRERAGVGA